MNAEGTQGEGGWLRRGREWELPATAHAAAWEPDGSGWCAACLDGGVYRWREGEERPARLYVHESYASGVARHPQRPWLLSAGYDGTLRWWDLEEGVEFRRQRVHRFWSWDSALSPDGSLWASVTGQYLCGGYRYEPAPETEPSVRVYDAVTGELRHRFEHVPPVQSVAFSRDGGLVAAGNLMGEVRVWETGSGREVVRWTTEAFTGWGIIKGHYYTGGIFALCFGPGDRSLYLAGMGVTRDPAAGNGRQLWEEYALGGDAPRLARAAAEGDTGSGLMETLAFHPSGEWFVMAGRLESGQWNAAVFGTEDGRLRQGLNTESRLTRAVFAPAGDRLLFAGGVSQDGPREGGQFRDYGRVTEWIVGSGV